MSYECPKCKKLGMDEDGRAKVFMCYYADCNTVIKFSDYNEIASILNNNVPRKFLDSSEDRRLPSRVNPLPDERVNNLLKFLYEDLKLR